MAIQATAVWRVRVGGNDGNGGAFDPSISGAGVDYSQQDGYELFVSDIACSNTTTVTSASAGFTANMVGNAMKISGGGATTGHYFITGYTNATTVTLDRTPGTVSGGSAKVGGASATFSYPMTIAVAENKIYVRGSGSRNPSSADYTESTYHTPTAGISVIGENGRPLIACNGLLAYQPYLIHYDSLCFKATGSTFGANGIIDQSGAGPMTVRDCYFNQNSQAVNGIQTHSAALINCEFYGGTTSPSGTTYAAVLCGNYDGLNMVGCYIHHWNGHGVNENSNVGGGSKIHDSIIAFNSGKGVYLSTSITARVLLRNVTIHGNGQSGVVVEAGGHLWFTVMMNCIVSENGGYGLEVLTGTATDNDKRASFIDYNNFYLNTSGARSGISAGAHDLALDPQFTDAANGDFSIGINLRGQGFPLSALGS